ncbi:MAG: hypothetical protein ACSI46_08285 [Gloeotrichia echinulata DVL01]|nr:hypothetical protein [Gloeotrichia echinulata DEX184]
MSSAFNLPTADHFHITLVKKFLAQMGRWADGVEKSRIFASKIPHIAGDWGLGTGLQV